MRFSQFIEACKENDVWKSLSIYIVSSWVLLQVISLIAEPLGFTSQLVAYCLIFLLIGFPIFLFLLWRLKIVRTIGDTPVLDAEGEPLPKKVVRKKFNLIYFLFIGVISTISLGAALFIVNKNFYKPETIPVLNEDDKIAVLKFENLTGVPEKDLVGKMAVDWIIHGITRNELAQVISPKIIEDYSEVLRSSVLPDPTKSSLTDYLKPSKIIEGEYYLNDTELIFQCSITDEIMNKTLISFDPVSCDQDSPLDCIEALKERILGYFIVSSRAEENLEERPPKFQAYEIFNRALGSVNEGEETYLSLLEAAIEADSNYFEPQVYKLMHYYNNGTYKVADSLLKDLRTRVKDSKRQKLLLNLYEAMLNGNQRKAYEYQMQEYLITPFHLETNSNMMVFSMQFVNRPESIDSIYREIDMEGMNIPKCGFCQERLKIKALADIELGNYNAAINLLQPFSRDRNVDVLKKILVRAHIRAGNFSQADQLLASFEALKNAQSWEEIHLFGAKDYLLVGEQQRAAQLLSGVIASKGANRDQTELPDAVLTESLFFNQQYAEAEPLLASWVEAYPDYPLYRAYYAICLNQNEKEDLAERTLKYLDNSDHYQFGDPEYAQALYLAAKGDAKLSLEWLLKSVAAGHWYETEGFQNDPILKDLPRGQEFERVMTYWH